MQKYLEDTTMLRFAEPLTPAAKYLVAYSLDIADDEWHEIYADPDAWAEACPRVARCFSLTLACTIIKDLWEKLERQEVYQLTDYHWLLLYGVLAHGLIPLNDLQIPEVNQELQTLASKGDGYLRIRRRRRGSPHVTIDFDWFIDKFFWDTDFLESVAVYEQLDPRAKQSLGANSEAFGVIQGMAPHPDELRLEIWADEENTSL
jgi:hypothetical protein